MVILSWSIKLFQLISHYHQHNYLLVVVEPLGLGLSIKPALYTISCIIISLGYHTKYNQTITLAVSTINKRGIKYIKTSVISFTTKNNVVYVTFVKLQHIVLNVALHFLTNLSTISH